MKIWVWFVIIGIILTLIGLAASYYDDSYFMAPYYGLGLSAVGLIIAAGRLMRRAKYED